MLSFTGSASIATGMTSWFPFVFAAVAVLILAVFAYVIYAKIRSRRVLRRAGHDPDTIDADLIARAMRSDLLAPGGQRVEEKSVEEKLAEIDRLHAAGSISDGERADARRRILAD